MKTLELHVIQNFPPSNLNRDDTGSPKTAVFGGNRRARVAPQCSNYAIRKMFNEDGLIPKDYLSKRTKRVVETVTKRLLKDGRTESQVQACVAAALSLTQIDAKQKEEGVAGETSMLLFLGEKEIQSIAEACERNWDSLLSYVEAVEKEDSAENAKDKKAAAAEVKNAKEALKPLSKEMDQAFHGEAIDLALFGRMIATPRRDKNIDGAVYTAHAIATHSTAIESDFYSVIDDVKGETAHLGDSEFTSMCMYRYACVDLAQLRKNLGEDPFLVETAINGYLRAAINVIPSGKQHTSAAFTPPSMVLVVLRDNAPLSLANAFEKPVRATQAQGLVENSIQALDEYWGRIQRVYEGRGIRDVVGYVLDPVEIGNLGGAMVQTQEQLIERVLTTLATGSAPVTESKEGRHAVAAA